MPAYIHHHEVETAPVFCPGCIGLLPMYVREVEPLDMADNRLHL